MRKPIGAVAVVAALTACSSTTTVVHGPAPKSTPTRAATVKPAPAGEAHADRHQNDHAGIDASGLHADAGREHARA